MFGSSLACGIWFNWLACFVKSVTPTMLLPVKNVREPNG